MNVDNVAGRVADRLKEDRSGFIVNSVFERGEIVGIEKACFNALTRLIGSLFQTNEIMIPRWLFEMEPALIFCSFSTCAKLEAPISVH